MNQNDYPKCPKCNKLFSRLSAVNAHFKKNCPVFRFELITKNQTMEIEIKALKKEFAQEMETLKKKHSEEICLLKEQNQQKFSDYKDNKLDKYEAHILKEKKPNISITTFNLAPYDLSQKMSREICKSYTSEDFARGPEATYEFITKIHLRNSSGVAKIRCTDISRRMFKGTDENGYEFTDVGGKRFIRDIIQPVKKAVRLAGIQYQDKTDISDEALQTKEKRHYRELEPTRVGNRLAGDFYQ